jgi:hypothetical protein
VKKTHIVAPLNVRRFAPWGSGEPVNSSKTREGAGVPEQSTDGEIIGQRSMPLLFNAWKAGNESLGFDPR